MASLARAAQMLPHALSSFAVATPGTDSRAFRLKVLNHFQHLAIYSPRNTPDFTPLLIWCREKFTGNHL